MSGATDCGSSQSKRIPDVPEFILDHGSVDASIMYGKLDNFAKGYVEAMFFTDTGHLEDEDLHEATVAELADETWVEIERDCTAFQGVARELLTTAYTRDYDEMQAGRDFWLTRNGHGAGFWDRDQLKQDGLGDRLKKLCGWKTEFAETGMYRGDDGKLYLL
jgi:hypothetical protein